MKITTAQQQQGYIDSTIEGGIKGAMIGVGILVPTTMVLRARSAYFRTLPLPLKVLGAVSVIVPSITISAEKAGEAFSRTQWTGVGQQELELAQRREQERWERLGTWGQVGDWAKRRKWWIIGGSWAATMVGSYALVARNKHQTFAQKIVQARVYAQAATVAVVLAAAIMQGTTSNEVKEEARNNDHSWREILEQEGYLKNGQDERAQEKRREAQLSDAQRVAQPQRGA